MRQILTDDFWGFHKNMNNEYAVLIPHANTQSLDVMNIKTVGCWVMN